MGDIAVLLMVKDEENNICTTLDSVRDFPVVFVYDTGSTDETLSIAGRYPNVRIFTGTFVDFATSRNTMHEIAEREVSQEYFLLMDAGDQFVKTSDIPSLDQDAYMVKQIWQNENKCCYYNTRLIRRTAGLRYIGKVHEYLRTGVGNLQKIESFHLYQDRRTSASSSIQRWHRDLAILEGEVRDNNRPDPRNVFYLAQTYLSLRMYSDAFETYAKRSRMITGFHEERFTSMLKCGDLARSWDERLCWYMKSFDLINRAEPLVRIADKYLSEKRFFEAWMFSKMACELEYPKHCVLFVEHDIYSYKRWHILGICSFYAGKLADGKKGCEMAIEAKNLPVDIANLKFYTT